MKWDAFLGGGHAWSSFLCLYFREHFQLISNIDMCSEYLAYFIVTQQGSNLQFMVPFSSQQKPRTNIPVQFIFCLARKGEL